MKNNTSYIVLFLLLSLAVVGCRHKDPVPGPGDEIRLSVSTTEQVETRALTTINNDTELTDRDIRIDAYFGGTTTSLFSEALLRYRAYTSRWEFYSTSASDWTHYYWPIEGSVYTATSTTVGAIDFVGYVPYTPPTEITLNAYSASNGPSFSAALPVSEGIFNELVQTSVQEYMYAYATDKTKDDDDGKVALTFQHPFALVNIYLKSALRGTVINTVELEGIKTSGTFVHNGGWDEDSLDDEATLSKTVDKTVPNELNFNALIGGPFMVIPQDVSGSENLVVNRTYNAVTADVKADFSATWEPGHIYNYYLDLGKDSGRILVDVVVEAWQAHTVPTIDVK